MQVFDAVRLRRSIKPESMKPDPIPEDVLQNILEAGNWAPSHGLTEPWRFIGFRGEGRRALGEALCAATAEPDCMAADDPRRAKLITKVMTAPVCLAIVCAPSSGANIVEHEEIASVAMAVQNMHLVARSHGLAAFWSSGKKAFAPSMARFLGLTPPSRCLGFFFLGYPGTDWPDGQRRPVEEKVIWRDE
ncbi:MAG: nitroreductase [Myxococcota bacterium]